jgi:magnesium-transporting ATPase (P-type)
MTGEDEASTRGLATSLSIADITAKGISSGELARMDGGLFRADLRKYKLFFGLNDIQKKYLIACHRDDGDVVLTTAGTIEDTLPQFEADLSAAAASDVDPSTVQNADIVFQHRDISLIPECIRYARGVYFSVEKILQYSAITQFTLLFAALFSFLARGRILLTTPSFAAYGFAACLPVMFALSAGDRRRPLSRPGESAGKRFDLNGLVLLPLMTSLCSVLATAAIYVLCNRASGSEGQCGGCALITMLLAAVFVGFALESEGKFVNLTRNPALFLCFGITAGFLTATLALGGFGAAFPPPTFAALSVLFSLVPAMCAFSAQAIVKKQ